MARYRHAGSGVLVHHQCLAEYARQLGRLAAPEARTEAALDYTAVNWPHRLEHSFAGRGDANQVAAAVLAAGVAADKALLLEPIDQPRQVVLAQQHPLAELELAQTRIPLAPEFEQRVVPVERRQAGVLERRFDPLEQQTVAAVQVDPGLLGLFRGLWAHANQDIY